MKKGRFRFSHLYMGLVLAIMYLPILLTVLYSFNESKISSVWGGFSLTWYRQLFQDEEMFRALWNSIVLAVCSCLLAAVLGTLGAFGMTRVKSRLSKPMEYLSTLPIMIPEIILGMAYLSFFSLLQVPFGMLTLVAAHTTFCVPYIFINVKASLQSLDPALGEAALDLGASRRRVFFDITAPLIFPSILSGSLLAFAMSMDDVVISFFVTGPETATLPLQVYSMLKMGVTPEINALCTVMLGTVFLLVAGVRLFQSARQAKKGRQ